MRQETVSNAYESCDGRERISRPVLHAGSQKASTATLHLGSLKDFGVGTGNVSRFSV